MKQELLIRAKCRTKADKFKKTIVHGFVKQLPDSIIDTVSKEELLMIKSMLDNDQSLFSEAPYKWSKI